MGQIVSSAAKPKRCNLNQLSQVPTPAAGEHILVSSDNSMNAAGQGNFDAYVVGNGRDAATELELKSIEESGRYEVSGEWIRVVTDNVGRILCGIKVDGSIEWSIGVPTPVREYVDAQIAAAQPQDYDEVVDFLGDLINGDSLQELLSGKVDKVDGKSLIDNQFAESCMSDEFIQAVVDANGRVLQGIKPDGSPYFPNKELISVEDNTTDYIEATLDANGKIVEGIKNSGEHDFNAGLGVAGIANMSAIEQSDFVDIKVDFNGKILEGTRKDGSKYIGAFDESTKHAIKEIAGGEGNSFSIPLLDSNFTSPVPCKIFNGDAEDDSVKGEDNAKYVFDLNLKEAFNIRFKFRITEDIYNAQKECYIAKLGVQKVLRANPRLLTQLKTTATYNGEQKDMFWPSFYGGISLNDASVTHTNLINNSNIGDFAFSIRYTGESHNVTIQNTGSAFILKIGDDTHTLSYTDYPTVAELYAALGEIAGIELSFNDIENRNSSELAVFAESKLVSLCYTGVNGENPEVVQEYWDSGSFYIPYSVGETWHQVEIVKIEDNIYVVCDGYTETYNHFTFSNIVLGGECGVLFKDLEVSMDSSLDAESTRVGIISGVNPYILIFEGHGLTSKPSHEVPNQPTSLLSTPDRLQHLFVHLRGMGYVPISIEDVADYFDGKKMLPKRCYVPIFDDFELENCLDLKNRAPFTRMGVEPTLAIASNNADTRTIVYNNQEISFQQANDICKTNHFTLVSHTRNHRNSQAIKPSEYINELEADIHDQDLKRIVSNILVFPYGRATRYLADTMQWVGFRLGINIARDPLLNGKYRSKYNLYREELGLRDSYDYVISRIV